MTSTKKPTKRQREAAARREAREAEEQAKARNLADAITEAERVAGKLPADFSAWGTVRTQAWVKYADYVQRQARLVRPHAGRLKLITHNLSKIGAWPLARCQEIAMTPTGNNPEPFEHR